MIFYLLYFGVARNTFTPADFEILLQQSRSRNESLGITGKLLHCEDLFIQLLEGGEESVNAVYHSIQKDQRLIAAKMITSGTADHRYYSSWSMAFKNISLKEINEIENCAHPDVATYVKKSSAIKLLKLLAQAN